MFWSFYCHSVCHSVLPFVCLPIVLSSCHYIILSSFIFLLSFSRSLHLLSYLFILLSVSPPAILSFFRLSSCHSVLLFACPPVILSFFPFVLLYPWPSFRPSSTFVLCPVILSFFPPGLLSSSLLFVFPSVVLSFFPSVLLSSVPSFCLSSYPPVLLFFCHPPLFSALSSCPSFRQSSFHPPCPASPGKEKTKVRPDCSSAPTQLALCLRLAYIDF